MKDQNQELLDCTNKYCEGIQMGFADNNKYQQPYYLLKDLIICLVRIYE